MWKRLRLWVLTITWVTLTLPFLLIGIRVFADTSAGVTVTATGYICEAPGGLTLTYISDYEVGISWTKGADAEKTMIRAAYGRMPESRTDGYLVYYDDGTLCSDTAVNFDETVSQIHYKAWSQNVGGLWEEAGTSEWIEGALMTLVALFILCGIISFLAIRSAFGLLKFASGAAWIAMFIYWMSNPPTAVAKGSPPHVAVMLVLIVMAVAIPLLGLGRDIRVQEDWRKGEKGAFARSKSAQSFHIGLPGFMQGFVGESSEKRRRRVAEETEDYRDHMHEALRPKRSRR